METSKGRGPGKNKRFWSEDEDKHLIESFMELNNERKFKAEGNFKLGYLRAIEMKLKKRMLGCDIQAKPHIESRMKTLKTHFQIVHEMLTGPLCSGFGWNSNRKIVTAEKLVWEAYLQSHKEAAPFKIKSFPWYDDLCAVFGKDRATGKHPETVIEKASIRLSKAIGEDFNEKHMQLGKDVPDDEKDELARVLFNGSL
ncbi:hypothetical protein G4B88_007166 [Cannabis sativa]|uniref:Myb/SANT-like domain-containing protein n=1 Tax=Cannabis sativa TaxID=3483 RepID=A0A7J6DJ80_CANSA|nr:hypothetical protein G4B88_007166 [Cannabis sativa]